MALVATVFPLISCGFICSCSFSYMTHHHIYNYTPNNFHSSAIFLYQFIFLIANLQSYLNPPLNITFLILISHKSAVFHLYYKYLPGPTVPLSPFLYNTPGFLHSSWCTSTMRFAFVVLRKGLRIFRASVISNWLSFFSFFITDGLCPFPK